MTFRLTNMFYLFAVVAASLAAFGALGVWAAGGTLLFWVGVFYLPRPGCVSVFVLGSLFVVLFATLLALAASGSGPHWHFAASSNKMRMLTTAIITYEREHGCLPPSAIRNGDQPPHSWRIATLPQIDHQDIFDKYRFDKPWNGPENSKLVPTSPRSQAAGETPYLAIAGSQTVWGDGEPRRLQDITDDAHHTILLIEAAGHGIPWTEPKDLSFDEAVELLTTRPSAGSSDGHRLDYGYFYKPSYVRNVTMCDGSAHTLQLPLKREAAVALLTANGGEPIDPEWFERQLAPQVDYARVWGIGLFEILALLPGVPWLRPWIWPQKK